MSNEFVRMLRIDVERREGGGGKVFRFNVTITSALPAMAAART